MPTHALLIELRLLSGRYHGNGDWPPSPFRLFQALVAGAYGGRWASEPADAKDSALRWMERLDPPLIAAPPKMEARPTTYFVPNNDLDAVGGDPRRVAEIRVGKTLRPVLCDADQPILYAWPFDDGEELALRLCALIERLHTLGRGIDPAFAQAEVCSWEDAAARLHDASGAVARPAGPGDPMRDPSSPVAGSFDSLKARHAATADRFEHRREGRSPVTLFRQPSKPLFRSIRYDAPPARLLFDLMDGDGAPKFQPVPLARAAWLVEEVRDRLAAVLARSLPEALVERVVVGRGAGEADKARRLRILPLPSIGSAHADRAIRRVLIEVPPDCPIPAREVEWAAGSVHLGADHEGEIADERRPQLVRASDEDMLAHYAVARDARRSYRLWRTVTPAALPDAARRRRIDPARLRQPAEQKGAAERAAEEGRAAAAVLQALRHAGCHASVDAVRVQREPFDRKGERAEPFAAGTRFAKERLWHVELAFGEPVAGPLVLGDGRYLGLGLMAPAREAWRDLFVFPLSAESPVPVSAAPALAQAARRALMALSRDSRGRVPPLFSGHAPDGAPARSGRHQHVFLAADDADGDGVVDRLIVAAPWACDRTVRGRREERARFDRVISALKQVRAGRLGVVTLGPAAAPSAGDSLIGPACVWQSRTPYRPTRHPHRRQEPEAAVAIDLIAECLRRGLPRPEVDIIGLSAGPQGGGIAAHARLSFAVSVQGPLLLGRDSHKGGGMFAAEAA